MAWVVRVLGSTTHISWQHSHKLEDFLICAVQVQVFWVHTGWGLDLGVIKGGLKAIHLICYFQTVTLMLLQLFMVYEMWKIKSYLGNN